MSRESRRDGLSPIHPGEILKEEFLVEYGMSQYELAKSLNVPAIRISEIVRGKRSVTPDTALRLARFFGTSAEFWINLQSHYDLRVVATSTRDDIEREVPRFGQEDATSRGADASRRR